MTGFASGGIVAGPVSGGDGVPVVLTGCGYAMPGAWRGRAGSHQEESMKPTVGRIVHYVSFGTPPRPDGSQAFASECRAAVVTEVPRFLPRSAEPLDGCPNGTEGVWVAGLCVLNPTGQFFNRDVPLDESGSEGGTWHWPERAQ